MKMTGICLWGGALIWGLISIQEAAGAAYGVNLLVNGNAEQGASSSTGASITIPGWTVGGLMSVVPYGATGFPNSSSPGPDDRMNQFFAGGNDSASTAYQDISVSANATVINAGTATCDLTGYLGGYDVDNDNATLQVSFYNGATKISDGPTIGPVNATDRGNVTGLLFRYQCGIPVPANTTSLRVTLTLTRTNGTFNDGYADSLSLVLREPIVVTTTADSGPGSLRTAMTAGNKITFDPNLYATGAVINLLSPLPTLVGGMSLIGPGAKLLTIQRDPNTPLRIFSVDYTNEQAGVVVSGVTIANGSTDAYGAGGGMFVNGTGTTTVNNCVFSGNAAGYGGGGGIANNGFDLKLNSCIFTNNSAIDSGGAILNISFDIEATSCVFTGNTSSGAAAFSNYSLNVNLTGCLFTANTGSSTISNSSNFSTTNFNLTNCTFSGNSPTIADVYNLAGYTADDAAYVNIYSCTFVSPAAIYNGKSTPAGLTRTAITNTIFQHTSFNSNFQQAQSGGITSFGYNMSDDDGSGILTATGDRANTDPMLGPLQNNGGPTRTHALLAGSLAIDKGNSFETTDQRGAPRPVDDPGSINGGGNNADIGAYEYGSTAPAVVSSAALGNISTRVLVQTGDQVAIAGFIVNGTQPKKVIIRALGPSLTSFGVSGALANPTLELHDGSGALLASNNNWKDTNQAAIQATGFAPSNDLESAILATLPAGKNYTAIVQGVNNTTGIGLVEVYDLNRNTSDSRPANISTRGFVGTGNNVMIGGFVVVGSNNQQVLVRGMGPSLTSFGVQGALADPTLELHDGNGTLVASNNNWKDTQQAAIQATGFAPSNDLESAILRALVPGSYTAIVQGVNGATGVALVEVYTFKP